MPYHLTYQHSMPSLAGQLEPSRHRLTPLEVSVGVVIQKNTIHLHLAHIVTQLGQAVLRPLAQPVVPPHLM